MLTVPWSSSGQTRKWGSTTDPIGGAPLEIIKARKSEGAEPGPIPPPTKKARPAKKKLTAIAPSQPGEYASELLSIFFFFGSQHTLATNLPTDIVERLAAFESASQVDWEALAGLSEKVARLEAENRSMRDWFSDQLLSVWENTRSRDAGVMQVLQNMHTLLMEESSHQGRLQVTAERTLRRYSRFLPSRLLTPPTPTTPLTIPLPDPLIPLLPLSPIPPPPPARSRLMHSPHSPSLVNAQHRHRSQSLW